MLSVLTTPGVVFVSLIAAIVSFLFFLYFLFRLALFLPGRLRALGERFLLSIAMLVILAAMTNVLATRNEVCLACHASMQSTGKHASLSCVSCHQDPGLSGALVFRLKETRMLLVSPVRGTRAAFACVPENTCRSCHERPLSKTQTVGAIRVRHVDFIGAYACVSCHPAIGHHPKRQASVMETCAKCHARDIESKNCRVCHTGKIALVLAARSTFAQYRHDSLWRATHGLKASNSCFACHERADCQRCHETYPHFAGWPAAHGQIAKTNVFSCRTCHLITACNDCHGIEMPHPDTWRKEHGAKARLSWKTQCSNCHTRESCLACHSIKELRTKVDRSF